MRCTFEDIPETEDSQGWRKVRCKRIGCRFWSKPLAPTPHDHSDIHARCTGIPEWHEFGSWISLIAGAFGMSENGYLAIKSALGLVPKCGCARRESKLNALGSRIRQALVSVVGAIRRKPAGVQPAGDVKSSEDS